MLSLGSGERLIWGMRVGKKYRVNPTVSEAEGLSEVTDSRVRDVQITVSSLPCVSTKSGTFCAESLHPLTRAMGRGMYGPYFALGLGEMKSLPRIAVNSEPRCSLCGSFRLFLSSPLSRVGCGMSPGWAAGEWGC